MSKALTAATAAQVKPKLGEHGEPIRTEKPDAQCAGLYLVIQPNGAKSWAVRYRSPVERGPDGQRKAKKFTLGPLAKGHGATDGEPEIGKPLTLAAARALATAALRKVERGIDPTHELRADKSRLREAASNTGMIDDAVLQFLRRYRGKKKQGLRDSTRRQTALYFGLKQDPQKPDTWIKTGKGVLKHWSGRPLHSITKRDVIALLDSMVDAGSPVSANRTLVALKTFFSWAVNRDEIPASPAATVEAPAEEKSRDRVLTDTELAALWLAAEADAFPFGRLVQLLILTAARRDELREAPWSEFDIAQRVWKLPSERAKNAREHHVPLSGTALSILEKMPQIKSKRHLIFTTTGETPISGMARAKRRLDKAMLEALRKNNPNARLQPWTLHDIRRTVASGLQRLGFPIEHVEAVLNHKSGQLRGVAGIYARHDYLEEKRQALEAWSQHLAEIGSSVGGARQ